jgi:hypothetical protein
VTISERTPQSSIVMIDRPSTVTVSVMPPTSRTWDSSLAA